MVTKAEVEKVAALAKLEFAPSEIEALTGELNSVLGYIDQLKEVDVRDVATLETMNEAVVTADSTPLRADIVRPSVPVEAALKNAPKSADRYFLVPKVLATETKVVRPAVETDDEEEML